MKKLFLCLFLTGSLSGCAALSDMWKAGNTPKPGPGPTPFQEIGDGLYHLILNPLDISSWLQIAGAGAAVFGAAVGVKKVHRKVRAKKVPAPA